MHHLIVGLLGVVFVTLKLLGVIDWSWWLVTLPFWGGAVLVLGVVGVMLLMAWRSVHRLR